MKILVIYAHPKTVGHNSLILKSVKNQLDKMDHEYELIDLYKLNYDPILHEDEHYTSGNKNVSKQNLDFQKKIKESDYMIFIFPVWWGTMPAMLRGFFERVFTPGFAYRYDKGIPIKLLKEKKALVFYTTGGPKIYFWLTCNRPRKNIKMDILNFCGIKAKLVHFDRCRKLTDSKIKKIKNSVKKAIVKIS